jgi:phage gpG-like protein
MGLKIEIEIKGLNEAQRRIAGIGKNLTNLKLEMEEVGKYLVGYYSTKVFLSQGAVLGQKWPALSPTTLAARGIDVELDSKSDAKFVEFLLNKRGQSGRRGSAAGVSGTQPLIDTGKMQHSFVYAATNNQVVVTNTAKQFKYHQSSAARKSKLPRRAMMGINSPIRQRINQIVTESINQKLQRPS